MAHKTSKSYLNLQQRLDKAPQGAPASETLFKILEILFTEKEAELASKLPIRMFGVEKAAKIWKKDLPTTTQILDDLSEKGILMDLTLENKKQYLLAPTMAGFFEFSLMRTDGKFDNKILSQLYHQYINKEDKFVNEVLGLNPAIIRTFIHEDTIESKDEIVVMDYERASKVIDTATCITVGTCYCRHKMEHMGKACDMPQDVCLTFNKCAESLSKHGVAEKISKEKAQKILKKCRNLGLVQMGDNVQDNVNYICNCCGCCCEALLAYKKLGASLKVNSNFSAKINQELCSQCGICIKKCPVNAISKKLDKKTNTSYIQVDSEKCIGCGVCKKFCPKNSINMKRRKETVFVPKDSFEKVILTAINTGKLQNIIIDNHHIWTYDLFRRLLGVILKLAPRERLMVDKQLRSKFINGTAKLYYKLNKIPKSKQTDYSHKETI